ncbi:PKD domain-containing protein [Blastococcus sp. SYSU D00820]
MPSAVAQAPRRARRASSAVLALALSAGMAVLGLAVPSVAQADSAPDAGVPATVTADALGTVQVNGVVWSMVTVGNTVYATGSFSQARPAGAAPGTQQTPRANLLAFNLTTGALVTSFNHTLNGQGRTITASPDGSRIYVGGDFTTVDGVARGHIAAFSTATGALITTFAPTSNNAVYALAATNTTVYAGGNFTTAGGQSRTRLAAFNAGNGAVTSWAPTANNTVRGLALTPDGSRVVLGGQFDTVNGTSAVAVASVNTAGGDTRTWNLGITNAGDAGGAYSLRIWGGVVYTTIYGFQIGNHEGTVALDPYTLGLVWMNDCHGDPYDTFATGGVVYTAGHPHDCETSGYFPDQSPTVWKRVIANTVAPTGTLAPTTKTPRYTSWTGRPHPALLSFFPTLNAGTYTGQGQGPWALTGNADYLVMGGEFTNVNGTAQQGLVRMASSAIAPDRRGPELTAAQMRPNALSNTAGQVTVRWPSSWDMDNENLTYRVYRGSATTPVHTVTVKSQWWNRTYLEYTESLPAGSTPSYRVTVSDPMGNTVTSTQGNTVTVAGETSAYAAAVLADGPAQYWRLGETTGTTSYDQVGTVNLTEGTGVTRGVTGAVPGNAAIGTNGTANGRAVTTSTVTTPTRTFSVETWVRADAGATGVIAQFGNSATAANTSADRGLYVDSAGQLTFALTRQTQAGTTYTSVRSPAAITDGQWHHVAVTVGTGGTTLYVDGAQVAANPAMTSANGRLGTAYWMFGTGTLAGWPNAPAGASLTGSLDEVAVYNGTLTAAQVAAHRAAATGQPPANTPPTASFTSAVTGLQVAVDGTGSTDGDGTVTGHSWNWGDGSAPDTTATASHTYATAGTYTVTLTVTDDDGATGTLARSVTVAAATNAAPTAAFTSTATGLTAAVDGTGSADAEGPIAGYAWNWGDGTPVTTGTTPTASHTYATAGTYTVTLTVTDGAGATGSTTRQVTVTAPPTTGAAFAADAFGRTVTGGLGTADLGGAWTVSAGATRQAVGNGVATLTTGAGNNSGSYLGSVSQTSTDLTARLTLNQAPTGSGATFYLAGRRVGSAQYTLRVRFLAGGAVRVGVVAWPNSSTETLLGAEVALPGTYTPGTALNLRFQVSGTGTTKLDGRVWTGATEPTTWTVSRTDATAALQAAGGIGISAYLSSSATSAVTWTVDDVSARPVA